MTFPSFQFPMWRLQNIFEMAFELGVLVLIVVALWWIISKPLGIIFLQFVMAGVQVVQILRWWGDAATIMRAGFINAGGLVFLFLVHLIRGRVRSSLERQYVTMVGLLIFVIWSYFALDLEARQAMKRILML